MNRIFAIKMQRHNWDTKLHTLPSLVSASEASQMDHKVEEFVKKLLNSSVDLSPLLLLEKPLRPVWFSPDSVLHQLDDIDFAPIICLSASKCIKNEADDSVRGDSIERRNNFYYVQGSADDHELWAMGLTPRLFWKYKAQLLTMPSDELPEFVKSLVMEYRSYSDQAGIYLIKPTSTLFFGAGDTSQYDIVVTCETHESEPEVAVAHRNNAWSIIVRCPSGKRGQKAFTQVLPTILEIIATANDPVILISSTEHTIPGTHMDIATGITLAILSRFYSQDGQFQVMDPRTLTKPSIMERLLWVTSSPLNASPARETILRINEFFLAPQKRKDWFNEETGTAKRVNQLQLLACGSNVSGQLGAGDLEDHHTLKRAALLDYVNVKGLKGGGNHSLLITTANEVLASGAIDGQEFQAFQKNRTSDVVDVAAGWTTSFYITAAGNVLGQGQSAFGELGGAYAQSEPTSINGPSSIQQVSAGMRHVLACSRDTVWGWGANRHGQLGFEGDAVCSTPTEVKVPSEDSIAQVACGSQHSLVLTSSGRLFGCGSNRFEQLGRSSSLAKSVTMMEIHGPWAPLRAVACSWHSSFAIDRHGRVWSWGRNNHGQRGRSSSDIIGQVPLPVTSKTQLNAGSEHCIVRQGDNVYVWGWNEHGNLGLGHTDDILLPTKLELSLKAKGIAAGCGTTWIWGYNYT